jgi:cytochrome c2
MVSAVLLILALAWALYDEAWGDRPWKRCQREFIPLYMAYLRKIEPVQAAAEKQLRDRAEAQALEAQIQAADDAANPKSKQIDAQLAGVRRQLAAIQQPFEDARARVAALEYRLDHASAPQGKDAIRADIERARRDGGLDHLRQLFDNLKSREAELSAQRAAATAPGDELRARLNAFLNQNRDGPGPAQVAGLLRKAGEFRTGIRQIYLPESGQADRCESCHVGIREPIPLTAANMGGQRVFASHPNPELLAIHDPERFGCTACHSGNGLAVSSVKEAHGNYEHWEWPLFSPENRESGCQQCHAQDRVLDDAPILTRGKDLFQLKGCAGCHRFQGFDREADALAENRSEIRSLERRQSQYRIDRALETKRGDEAESNEETQRHYAAADVLLLKASQIDAQIEALEAHAKSLQQDVKQAGPNLKDVRLKLRKEWLPRWLQDPQALNPGTKMPRFRLADGEVRALSAFIWQAGWEGPKPDAQKPGNAADGKQLFEARGCLACHSIGEGASRTGGDFAANLTHIGQKANYDYIVRWIHDPRQRTRPYCPREQRDLTTEDYARAGKPFLFDADHSRCPNDGAELQIQNMTVMPSLRLSVRDAQDIATYLFGLSLPDDAPTDVSFMDDQKPAETGRALVTRYGCANCHEIRGFENTRDPATELTTWASKPLEQLDFGLLEGKAKKEGWYSHKGFVEHKLRNTAIYDQGRDHSPTDRLKMPDVSLAPEELRALSTFILSSIDTPSTGAFRTIPDSLRYQPTGAEKDVQDGWWLIRKYNCMGCHSIQIGQKSVLSGLPQYADPDMRDQLPPSLIEEGARVSPDWLARFLANPALDGSGSDKAADRNGVRTYLRARMPTFRFSPNEIAILVRFFAGLSGQPAIAEPVTPEPLDDRERLVARALFSSPGAPCLQCHVYGDPVHDRQASAPNFLSARDRLKPGWTLRWLIDPQTIIPGTAMPSQLFRRAGDRWVLAGQLPKDAQDYPGDHAQLLVRYMLQMTPDEQRRLIGMMPRTGGRR